MNSPGSGQVGRPPDQDYEQEAKRFATRELAKLLTQHYSKQFKGNLEKARVHLATMFGVGKDGPSVTVWIRYETGERIANEKRRALMLAEAMEIDNGIFLRLEQVKDRLSARVRAYKAEREAWHGIENAFKALRDLPNDEPYWDADTRGDTERQDAMKGQALTFLCLIRDYCDRAEFASVLQSLDVAKFCAPPTPGPSSFEFID